MEGAGLRHGGRILLDRIDIALKPGEITVIVGPNGAGKSTLVKLMSGELRPTAGVVRLDGRPLETWRPRDLAVRRAVLAQSNETALGFTVGELAALGLRLLPPQASSRVSAPLVHRALARVGLSELERQPVGRLSGGERQRAHLARVLVQLWAGEALTGPGLLLLDEPIAAQDLAHQLLVLGVGCEHAQAGGTVCMVLHDLNWAACLGERWVVLSRGRIYADGPPASVFTRSMLADVFGVELEPNTVPAPDRLYVLPDPPLPFGCEKIRLSALQRSHACTSP